MMFSQRTRIASVLLAFTAQISLALPSWAQGPMPIPPPMHAGHPAPHVRVKAISVSHKHVIHRYPGSVKLKSVHGSRKSKRRSKKAGPPPPPPQEYVGNLSVQTLAPGVVHKIHRGAMYINVLDIDLGKANVTVKPILAGESFNTLDEVKDQAQKVHAIAAVNGNYFKRDGTPLGTLIIDGEWISGPLYDRTCMGITRDGQVLVDRVSLHGTLTTSNPDAPSIWVNNVNAPRRHGAHLIAYTRRWGASVKMQYEGTLVAVDSTGKVSAKDGWQLAVPYGGYVLSDSKESQIAKLNVGDSVSLSWQTNPPEWSNVVNAVSGGPVLIRDGKLFVDCHDEMFNKAWTGSQIHARTAVGVTANRHLLLATIEGPHTLYDVAKFLRKLGAVDAMNLDGGGSTTMVIGNHAVTHNTQKFERRVASALAILPRSAVREVVQYQGAQKVTPAADIQAVGRTVAPVGAPSTSPNAAAQPAAVKYSIDVPVAQHSHSLPAAAASLSSAAPLESVQRSVPMLPPVPAIQTQPPAEVAAGTQAGEEAKSGHFGWLRHHHSAD